MAGRLGSRLFAMTPGLVYVDPLYSRPSHHGNASDAEEVVQDALWTVVRQIATFRGDPAFGS
jgi:hypothetical protein